MASLREAQERYARHYLALAERAEPHLTGAEQTMWLDRLELEHENVWAVLRWAKERGARQMGLQLAGAVWRFWEIRGYLSEGRSWLERLLGRGPRPKTSGVAPALRAKALNAAGYLAHLQGDYAQATVLHEECLALAREVGNKRVVANSLHNLGAVAQEQGDYARAAALYDEGLGLERELGGKAGLAISLHNLGVVAYEQGDLIRALALYEEGLALMRELGDRRGIAISLDNLGDVAYRQGDYTRATALFEESLTLARDVGDLRGIAYCLEGLGSVMSAQEDDGATLKRAARLFAAAEVLRETISAS